MTGKAEWGKRCYQDEPTTRPGARERLTLLAEPGVGLDGSKYKECDWRRGLERRASSRGQPASAIHSRGSRSSSHHRHHDRRILAAWRCQLQGGDPAPAKRPDAGPFLFRRLTSFYADKGRTRVPREVKEQGYLRKIPADPMRQPTGKSFFAEPDPDDPTRAAGDLRRQERLHGDVQRGRRTTNGEDRRRWIAPGWPGGGGARGFMVLRSRARGRSPASAAEAPKAPGRRDPSCLASTSRAWTVRVRHRASAAGISSTSRRRRPGRRHPCERPPDDGDASARHLATAPLSPLNIKYIAPSRGRKAEGRRY